MVMIAVLAQPPSRCKRHHAVPMLISIHAYLTYPTFTSHTFASLTIKAKYGTLADPLAQGKAEGVLDSETGDAISGIVSVK
eukprot:m.291874 g.291874  ORF g.291874 m.291874 type:complete len:81 (-) comp15830_c0_seq5:68-310(-)